MASYHWNVEFCETNRPVLWQQVAFQSAQKKTLLPLPLYKTITCLIIGIHLLHYMEKVFLVEVKHLFFPPFLSFFLLVGFADKEAYYEEREEKGRGVAQPPCAA